MIKIKDRKHRDYDFLRKGNNLKLSLDISSHLIYYSNLLATVIFAKHALCIRCYAN